MPLKKTIVNYFSPRGEKPTAATRGGRGDCDYSTGSESSDEEGGGGGYYDPAPTYELPDRVDTSLYASPPAQPARRARRGGGGGGIGAASTDREAMLSRDAVGREEALDQRARQRRRSGWTERFANVLSPPRSRTGSASSQVGEDAAGGGSGRVGGGGSRFVDATHAIGGFYNDDIYPRFRALNSTVLDVVQSYSREGANANNSRSGGGGGGGAKARNNAARSQPVDPHQAMAGFVKDGGIIVKGAHKAGRCLGNAVAVTLFPVRTAGNRADPNGAVSRSAAAYELGNTLVVAGAQALGTVNTVRNVVLVEGGSRLADAITSTGVPLAGPISKFAMKRVNGALTKTIGAKAAFVMGAASAAFPAPPTSQDMH